MVDCADWQELEEPMKEEQFFGGLRGVQRMRRADSQEPLMLKLRDWPPAGEFKQELPRHNMVGTDDSGLILHHASLGQAQQHACRSVGACDCMCRCCMAPLALSRDLAAGERCMVHPSQVTGRGDLVQPLLAGPCLCTARSRSAWSSDLGLAVPVSW